MVVGQLLAGCTAGDIRVNFQVADPRSLSVVAKAVGVQAAAEDVGVIDLVPYTAPNGFKVAIAHAGELFLLHAFMWPTTLERANALYGATGMHHATDMFDNESAEARKACYYARAMMVLAGFCVSFLMQAGVGCSEVELEFAPRALLSLGCAQLLVSAVWFVVWGAGDLVS